MKIACTDCGKFKKGDKNWIDEALELGFSYMEIAVSNLPDDESLQDDILSYAVSRGLTLSLHAPYGVNNISSSDLDRRASSIANLKHSIDLSARHGLGTVTFHPGRLTTNEEDPDEHWETLMAIVTDIAQYAKEKKVRVGIENMEKRPYELVFTVDDLNRFAHLTENNPYFGATIDFAHYSSHNIGLPNLDELKLPLYNVHLSQNTAGKKMHHSLVCEDGLVDLVEVCRSLENYGYDKLVVLEVGGIVLESKQTLEAALKELEA